MWRYWLQRYYENQNFLKTPLNFLPKLVYNTIDATVTILSNWLIQSCVFKSCNALFILYHLVYGLLGGRLLVPSLPGKDFRMLLELRGLPKDLICVLEAEPGKLEIKRCEAGILFISLPIGLLFKIVIMTYNYVFVSIQRHWQHN